MVCVIRNAYFNNNNNNNNIFYLDNNNNNFYLDDNNNNNSKFWIRGLSDNIKEAIKQDCTIILRNAKPPKINISKDEF